MGGGEGGSEKERERDIPHWLNHIRDNQINSNCPIMRGTVTTGLLTGRT